MRDSACPCSGNLNVCFVNCTKALEVGVGRELEILRVCVWHSWLGVAFVGVVDVAAFRKWGCESGLTFDGDGTQ